MQATQEPFLKLAELWHAATGRRPEEIFALRHCDIDIKRGKFRLRGNCGSPMMASAGLNGSLKSCAALSLSCMIGGCCWSLLLLFCCSFRASLTPSCPPEIGLLVVMTIPAPLALAAAAVAADGLSARRLLQQTPYRGLFPFVQAVLRFFLSLAGWNYPISPMPPSPQQWRQAFSSLPLSPSGSYRTAASSSWVVAHPELDGEAQKRCQGIMVNDTKLVAVMHYRVYNILKFFFSYSEPYDLGCFIKLFFVYRHLF